MDLAFWRNKEGNFKPRFSSKDTWNQVCSTVSQFANKGMEQRSLVSHATPKYSFLIWLATHNKLTTAYGLRVIECVLEMWVCIPNVYCIEI